MAWGRRRGKEAKEEGAAASEIDVEAKALMLLSMRDHSVGELERKLRERYYPDEHIEAVVERFRDLNYLDDERTSRRFASSLARQGWGPLKVRVKMYERRFENRHINEALEAIEDEVDWIEAAADRIRSKFRKEPDELESDEQEKAYRHLGYRGFPGHIARKVLFEY